MGHLLRDAVVAMFLETGKDHTVKEIAARMGWSEGKVRRNLTSPSGFMLDGIEQHTEGRTSYSKDYRGFEIGSHKVAVYGPTRALLREIITTQKSDQGDAT